jgi:hypothetical protein
MSKNRKDNLRNVPEHVTNMMYCPVCGEETYIISAGEERGHWTFFLECDNEDTPHPNGRKWKLMRRERIPRPDK